ncbi:alpha/beta fold hydrolase [Pararhizobium haloflavum]|uniref:alpha/beta fold hydrolase n=1 Tax=Pararhizobium haloflavum TaxID=2037914 RepID=UPI000C1A258D|nr:alpha/beta hydrolase [Pararhizobium haloflavum]
MSTQSKLIKTSHAAIHVRDNGIEGTGLPIVMIHGSSSAGAVFLRQFASDALLNHRLVAIDLPGHGLSGDAYDPTRTYTVRGLADTIKEVLGKLEIARCIFVGWSLGGHVALEIAATTQLAAGVLLSGTPPVHNGPLGLLRGFQAHWDLFLVSRKVFSEKDAQKFHRLSFGNSGDEQFLAAIRRADGRLRVNFLKSLMHGECIDQKRFVESSKTPIAIINGALDPFVRLGYIETVNYANLWRDRCHVIPATGHAPFIEAAELYNPLIAAFAADAGTQMALCPDRAGRVA